MKVFEATRSSWEESFGRIAERLWATKNGLRKGTLASLHREMVGIGYEGFRKMIDGQVAALGIDPREFPEYRLLEIHEACQRYPQIDRIFYQQIMETVARLDEKADALHAGEKSSLEVERRRETSSATQ
jgi:hypothetical protein